MNPSQLPLFSSPSSSTNTFSSPSFPNTFFSTSNTRVSQEELPIDGIYITPEGQLMLFPRYELTQLKETIKKQIYTTLGDQDDRFYVSYSLMNCLSDEDRGLIKYNLQYEENMINSPVGSNGSYDAENPDIGLKGTYDDWLRNH